MLNSKDIKKIKEELKKEGIEASTKEVKVLAGDWLKWPEIEARANDFAARAKDAHFYFDVYELGVSFDYLDDDKYKEHRDIFYEALKQSADYNEESLKQKLGIGVEYDEEGEPTGEVDEDAEVEDYLEEILGDNTYNWSWLGPGDANITFLKDLNAGDYYLQMRFHVGMDIRAGYTSNYYWHGDSEDDLYQHVDELFGGGAYIEIFFEDGSKFRTTSEQDRDIYRFTDFEVEGGGIAEELEEMLESLNEASDVDSIIEEIAKKVGKVSKEDSIESDVSEAKTKFIGDYEVIELVYPGTGPDKQGSNKGVEFATIMLDWDKENEGTQNYTGYGFFWAHEYRHYLRDASALEKRMVHDKFVSEGLELAGESDRHLEIIQEIVGK